MTRLRAALIFLAVWACVYLPGLGSTELKGEEGRRILPAVTMLDTGNWLVPYVGGKPFLRKPPLVNWMIAGSFAVTGVRNEWTARLPSALCVLALGLTLVALGSGRGWMDAETALVAAIMAATSFGLLAKARFAGAEIEGIYVPLAGIAMAMWMAWWTQRRSPWLTWTVPWFFLGLAALAKGPVHLVFFYAVVLAVLWKVKPRALRELLGPAHFVGLVLMVGIFAAWAVPYFQSEAAHAAAKVWRDQMTNRVTDNVFDWKSYLLNIPRGLMDQLPWLLFAPIVVAAQRRGREGSPSLPSPLTAFMRGTFLATVVCFFGFMLIPGVLPRYVLPLTLPWCVLLAFALRGLETPAPMAQPGVPLTEGRIALLAWHAFNRALAAIVLFMAFLGPFLTGIDLKKTKGMYRLLHLDKLLFDHATVGQASLAALVALAVCGFVLSRRPEILRPLRLVLITAALFGCGAMIYAGALVHVIKRGDNLRPVAAYIEQVVAPGETLFLYDIEYRPEIFYLHIPYQYAFDAGDIPKDAQFVLARGESKERILRKRPDLIVTRTFALVHDEQLLLLQPRAAVHEDVRPVAPKPGAQQ